MAAHGAAQLDHVDDGAILDVDTSAAILRWMDTNVLPDGILADDWVRWIDGGCRGSLRAGAVPVTPVMLGRWAQTGTLR